MPRKSVSNKDLESLGIKKGKTNISNDSIQVSRLINSQINATNEMKDTLAKAMKNPQLEVLVDVLTQNLQNKENGTGNKRLLVNRDKKGLIASIDVISIDKAVELLN